MTSAQPTSVSALAQHLHCARPPKMPMATTTLVSSVLGSLILRRKPTAATCRLQEAPVAPGLNLRPYSRSTCLLFSLSSSSEAHS